MKKGIFIIAGGLLFLASCAPQKTLYNWGKYQETSYRYVKTDTDKDRENLIKSYEYIINNQKEGRQVVPPGIYADYGYLLVKQGKTAEGLKLMKMEIALYPESEAFIGRIIKRLEEDQK